LRLRTKLLLSLVVVIAALTFSTLLIVGHAAEEQVQTAIEQDTRNSVLTFQNVRAERQVELVRQAEVLATLPSVKALMAGEDSTDIQGVSEGVWRSGNADLFALANWSGKIVALHTSIPELPASAGEERFSHCRGIGEASGWWFGQGHLYQVAISEGRLRRLRVVLHRARHDLSALVVCGPESARPGTATCRSQVGK
jgi:hypothetical protein